MLLLKLGNKFSIGLNHLEGALGFLEIFVETTQLWNLENEFGLALRKGFFLLDWLDLILEQKVELGDFGLVEDVFSNPGKDR